MILKARAMRDEDKLERRTQILDAAERLFVARPEGLLSMDELAEAAGVAKGTLYLYFPSKEEALLALHERNVLQVLDGLHDAMAGKTGATMEELTRLAQKFLIDSPIYLPLATLALSYISQVVPVESVIRVHKNIGERLGRTGAQFERALGLPAGQGPIFLQYTHALVLGLWQLSGCGRLVPEDIKAADPHMAVFVKQHPTEYSRALNALWTGMLGDKLKPGGKPKAAPRKTQSKKRSRK
jgi:AcrR family transcriptional regulator